MRRTFAFGILGIALGGAAVLLSGCGSLPEGGQGPVSATTVQGTTNGLGGSVFRPCLRTFERWGLVSIARASHGGDGSADGVTDRFLVPTSVTIAATFCGIRRADGTILELFRAPASSPAMLSLSNGAAVDWMRSGIRTPSGTYDALVLDVLCLQQRVPLDLNGDGVAAAGEGRQVRLWTADGGTSSSDARRGDLQMESPSTAGLFEWLDLADGSRRSLRASVATPYQSADMPASRQVIPFTAPVAASGGPADVIVTFTGNELFYDDTNGDGVFNLGAGAWPNMEGSGLANGSWHPIFPSADVSYRARHE